MVQFSVTDSVCCAEGIGHCDVIDGATKMVVHVEAAPGARNAWLYQELISNSTYAENRLQTGAVKPARGAGIPRPASSTGRRGRRIYVGGYCVRLQFVAGHLCWIAR